jgi:hypothetical protein
MVDDPTATPSTSPSVEASGLVDTCAAPERVTSNRPGRRWSDVGTREANEELRRRERVAPAPVDVSALDAWDAPEDEILVVVRTHTQAAVPGGEEALFWALAMASE